MTLKRSQTGKTDVFIQEILTYTTAGFLYKKHVSLWLEFTLFES